MRAAQDRNGVSMARREEGRSLTLSLQDRAVGARSANGDAMPSGADDRGGGERKRSGHSTRSIGTTSTNAAHCGGAGTGDDDRKKADARGAQSCKGQYASPPPRHAQGPSTALANPRLRLSSIRPSIGTEDPIPEEMDHREIAPRVPVVNEVQLLSASDSCKPLKPRSLDVVFLVEKDVRVERRAYATT